ncbi:hypothetical protein KCV06_g176, partial [Aureobasidium melanogenum]
MCKIDHETKAVDAEMKPSDGSARPAPDQSLRQTNPCGSKYRTTPAPDSFDCCIFPSSSGRKEYTILSCHICHARVIQSGKEGKAYDE